jgi:hypothetical protein
VSEPNHSLHIVQQVGEADFGCRTGQANGPDEQTHWPLLAGKDVFDRRAYCRFAGISSGRAARHRLAFGLFAMDL